MKCACGADMIWIPERVHYDKEGNRTVMPGYWYCNYCKRKVTFGNS